MKWMAKSCQELRGISIMEQLKNCQVGAWSMCSLFVPVDMCACINKGMHIYVSV